MSILGEFEKIELSIIEEYIDRQQEEHLTLDFKTLNSSKLNREDRKNLGKTISEKATKKPSDKPAFNPDNKPRNKT